MIMGLYDTFNDGENSIQLKNFGCCLGNYKKGEKIPLKENGYPKSGLFFCMCNPLSGVVVIKNSVFIGIERYCHATFDKHDKFRIWDCYGGEYTRKMSTKQKNNLK